MVKKMLLIAAAAMLLFAGCSKSPAKSPSTSSPSPAPSQQKIVGTGDMAKDRVAFSASIATPLTAEDAAIWKNIQEKSNNPKKVVFRMGQ
jgi:hypothetical protein